MLLVGVSCTEQDFAENIERLSRSLGNFDKVYRESVFIYVIYQSKSGSRVNPEAMLRKRGFSGDRIVFKNADWLSVSKARNEIVKYAKDNGFCQLIFHDASVVFTVPFLFWVLQQKRDQVLLTQWAFSSMDEVDVRLSASRLVRFDLFKYGFVWSYVFPVACKFPRFDERFGPGEFSVFKSGEDALFLKRFFELNRSVLEVLRFSGVGVLHPPRPPDYSKHYAYAFGQGKIHQIYLREERNLYALWRCALFFGNAFARVLLWKRWSLKILSLRIKGFLDDSDRV